MKLLQYSFLILSILLIAGACRSTKKKGEIGGIKKFYHNTTAYYNGYFNANEILTESVYQMRNNFEDNYTRILPVYKYLENPSVQSFSAQLDTAIKKVSVVVALHRPSVWTDDCYLLAGKAQYVKQEYEEAEKTLKFVMNEFDPSDPQSKYWEYKTNPGEKNRKKKRKKKKNRAEIKNIYAAEATGENAGALGHEPAYQESILWLGRTYIERDKDNLAERLLKKVHRRSDAGSELKTEASLALAHLYIETEQYKKGIPYLEYATENANDRQLRARYAFILAQVYEKESDHKKAASFYDRAESLSNSYEMIFNSKLNRLESAYQNKRISASEALKELDKMVKDDKNVDYLDQVYFTKAKIHLYGNEESEALANFRKSLDNNTGRQYIVAESYYELSNLYFKKDEFIEAKLYLDSTLQALPETDERYDALQERQNDLEGIYENLLIVEMKDSLLMISQMSEEEKEELAALLKSRMKNSKSGSSNSKNRNFNQSIQSAPPQSMASVQGRGSLKSRNKKQKISNFFAYSEDPKDEMKSFEKKWGERPLVDNWRIQALIDPSDNIKASQGEDENQIDESEDLFVSGAEMERIFADVPDTESEISQMESEIARAMFDLGFLYRQNLDRPDLTIKVLEELLERFPQTRNKLEIYYNLYLAYNKVGRIEKAQMYADKITESYPQTKFAKVIKDPDYADKLNSEKEQLDKFYKETKEAFTSENYDEARMRLDQVSSIYGEKNAYSAKFALIDAMVTGKMEGEEKYADKLRKLINQHPQTDEEIRAKEILRFLNGDNAAFTLGKSNAEFERDDDKMHYVIASINNSKEIDMNKAKVKISDFNKKYYQLKNLNISTQYLDIKDNASPLMIIRRFENKDKAMRYYETVNQFKKEFLPAKAEFDLFAITQQNYRQVLKERTIVGYRSFFEANYLQEN